MRVLGIETSCDETAVAVLENGNKVLTNVIASSADLHSLTGGVVPEVASREHVKAMIPTIETALRQANLSLENIDLIAVTVGPGLVGSLLIGIETAKAISFASKIKIIGVNHIVGHIYSNWLDKEEEIKFPVVIMTASGGHNHLVLMKNHYDFEILGKTRDDASGEAFDKIAKLLGLPYPGGPEISKRAKLGNPKKYNFPRSWLEKDSFDFSFSGLKSAVAREVHELELTDEAINDISASFQEAVVDVLATKLKRAADKYEAKEIHLAGGVSCNLRLREKIKEIKGDIVFRFPEKFIYCTDNAAMIASAGFYKYKITGEDDVFQIKVDPRLKI